MPDSPFLLHVDDISFHNLGLNSECSEYLRHLDPCVLDFSLLFLLDDPLCLVVLHLVHVLQFFRMEVLELH